MAACGMLNTLGSACRSSLRHTVFGKSSLIKGGFLAPNRSIDLLLPHTLQPARPFRHTPPVQMGRRSAKIALRKGKADAKKAKSYGRIGKKIIQLVKAGGPDPITNSKLSDLLKQAKDLGVPKDIIERNVKKASDAKQGDFQECIYEAYGPRGTGFVIEALTDNVNRTAGTASNCHQGAQTTLDRHTKDLSLYCKPLVRVTLLVAGGYAVVTICCLCLVLVMQ
eukprot:GHRR01026925.1.p1 GENE.GHRR01026925.1~~GHRR01026925.1.p1  ORF type:complete len:223 (+),score=46.46 GHRR01026925.1:320-988(+)